MTDTLVPTSNGNGAAILEQVVIGGDLERLAPAERVAYYRAVCESVGLNPLTKPFEYIRLNNKLTLYAKRDCTDQLRSLKGISVIRLEREVAEGIYVVTAYGQDAQGRTDSAIGAVPIANLQGENRANAMMKAETKAKRRLTLSLAGLGFLDETEVGTVPSAVPLNVDTSTGEILPSPTRTAAEKAAARRAELEAGADEERASASSEAPRPSEAPTGAMTTEAFVAWCQEHVVGKTDVAKAVESLGLDPKHLNGQYERLMAILEPSHV